MKQLLASSYWERNTEIKRRCEDLGFSFKKVGSYLVADSILSKIKYEQYINYGANIADIPLGNIKKTILMPKELLSDYYLVHLHNKKRDELICEMKLFLDDNADSNLFGGIVLMINYLDGKKHGLFRSWNAKGIITFETIYAMGFKQGVVLKYDNFSGELLEADNYEGNYLHGLSYVCIKGREESGVVKTYREIKYRYGSIIGKKMITEAEAKEKMSELRKVLLREVG